MRTTPPVPAADHAATVRDALASAMCGEWGKENAHAALDALLALANENPALRAIVADREEAAQHAIRARVELETRVAELEQDA